MTQTNPFVHLHLHTHYSLLDGANRIPDLVAKVKEHGMNAVAMTDHGNLYAAIEFYNTCKKNDLNPIIGYEAYVAPGDRRDKKAARMKEASFHLTLLAMNRKGFQNLLKLSTAAYLEGFYYKPRIDKPLLEAHSEGLICLSGCAASELSQYILGERHDEARALTEWYAKVFGDRFYMEIQNAGFDIQKECADGTIDIANAMGLPLVATNDAHYLNQEDADAHDILLCVNTRSTVDDEKRMKMSGDQLFVRTPEEMYAAFPNHAEAVSITQQIADRCDIDLDLTTMHYPVFQPPAEKTDVEYLRELCLDGMKWRYGEDWDSELQQNGEPRGVSPRMTSDDDQPPSQLVAEPQVYLDRLNYELDVIERMGYASYFLIVWDFVRFSRENGIPCQARGSAVGALVGYVLGLSNVCPIKYDLLFERFLDPNRSEPPDIDIDFCRDGRQAVIDYTKEKYGEMNVAQIGTFGTLKAKAAIRDVSRAMAIDLKRVDEICKFVPETLGIKLKDAIKESADLKEAYDNDPAIQRMLDIAMRLEGLARSAGTHAAGVVVADEPISNYIPLQTITGKTDIITQWDGPTVEMAGLLKMDFLGLRNLTILDKAVKNVKKHRGIDLDPDKLPLDDRETFALLQRGETKGIFQLESGGMRDLLTKMKPDKFEDIIATSALYRPGPLEGGMVTDYVERKHGREEVPSQHPIIDEVLAETYGVMVYQEQVMRILNRVGGIELASAYKCIKAISKKKLEIIAKFREEFVSGAAKQNMGEEQAMNLFGLIEKFAGYGFNKSHSTAYGAVAYQTAYLKAHYPQEFMAALLSCGMESSDRIAEHTDDCRRMQIEVLAPDVNSSEVEFGVTVASGGRKPAGNSDQQNASNHSENRGADTPRSPEDDDRKITFGLGAVKGVGENVVQAIVAEREANGPFNSIFDLTERVDPKVLNKSALEILIKAGALDQLGGNRAQHIAVVERAVQSAATLHRDRARGQKNLFGGDDEDAGDEPISVSLPDYPDWSNTQKLAAEKEVLGFYLTSHPLTQHAGRMRKFATHSTTDLKDMQEGERTEVLLSGMISSIKRATTKKGGKYANFDFEDDAGGVRCIIWPEQFTKYGEMVKPEAICFVQGKVEVRGSEPNLIVDRLLTVDEAEREFTQHIVIQFRRGLHTKDDMLRVRNTLTSHPGRTQVILALDSANEAEPTKRFRYIMPTPTRVNCDRNFQTALGDVLGDGYVHLHAGKANGGGMGR